MKKIPSINKGNPITIPLPRSCSAMKRPRIHIMPHQKMNIIPAINYEVNLTKLISSYRRDFNNSNMPFIIGKIHDSLDKSSGQYPYVELVREAMENVAFNDHNVGIVDTDAFPLKDDGIHFNSEGVIALGDALAEEYMALVQ